MQNMELYSAIFENLYDGIYFVDKQRKITFWNKGAERITGFLSTEVLMKHCFDSILVHTDENGAQLCFGDCHLHKSIWDNQIHEASVYLHHKDGHRIPVFVKTIPISENGETVGAVEIFQVQRESYENLYQIEELKKLALKDQLTGLPNRMYVEAFLKSKICEYSTLGIPFGVMFLDIDHLKNLNDLYGHEVGDDVLRVVAKTLIFNMLSTDKIGRWGGDVFVGVFACSDNNGLKQAAGKVRVLVENSTIQVKDQPQSVTISIGATLFRPDDTFESVLKRADDLLYISKSNGRNRVTLE